MAERLGSYLAFQSLKLSSFRHQPLVGEEIHMANICSTAFANRLSSTPWQKNTRCCDCEMIAPTLHKLSHMFIVLLSSCEMVSFL